MDKSEHWKEVKVFKKLSKTNLDYQFESPALGIHLSRQQVAFLKECRKIKGFGSLREGFYTKFKPEN